MDEREIRIRMAGLGITVKDLSEEMDLSRMHTYRLIRLADDDKDVAGRILKALHAIERRMVAA